jgi:hypothetical protein
MLLSLILASCAATADSSHLTSPSQAPEGFWDHWGDGQSEVSAYSLSQPRYGQDNPGEVVLIFVTETFTHEQRVKSDGGHRDAFPVMKLNAVRDFQTGFYDYNVMTSTFVPLSGETPRGIPTKQSFSMQEWCGNTYAELTSVHDYGEPVDGLRLLGHGYFDGESFVDKRIPAPVGGIIVDVFFDPRPWRRRTAAAARGGHDGPVPAPARRQPDAAPPAGVDRGDPDALQRDEDHHRASRRL